MLTLEGLIGVISLVLGAFSLGYAIGNDRGTPTAPESQASEAKPASERSKM